MGKKVSSESVVKDIRRRTRKKYSSLYSYRIKRWSRLVGPVLVKVKLPSG